jgi:hypothetical protein
MERGSLGVRSLLWLVTKRMNELELRKVVQVNIKSLVLKIDNWSLVVGVIWLLFKSAPAI